MKAQVMAGFLACSSLGGCMTLETSVLEVSRASTVAVVSQSAKSRGSGFFVGDEYVLTCFHVVAALTVKGPTVNWKLHPDLQIILPSGEAIGGTVVSVPTDVDPSPLLNDFALVKLKNKPSKNFAKVELASDTETLSVGDDMMFSGYPLATPGMVTHWGMVSGFDSSSSVIFVQASINAGNSGGALLNAQGHVVGIVSMREGGISRGLEELKAEINRTSSQGSVRMMGIDTLQSTKAIIETLDRYISTGIGYAVSVRFAREYLDKNPGLLK